MRQLTTTLLFVLLAFLLANCGSSDANTAEPGGDQDSTAVSDSADKKKAKAAAVPVEVTRLTTGPISNYLIYSSTLETEQTVTIYSRIAGLVEGIYVEESDYVRKGKKLLQIEKDEFVLTEENARIEYEKQKSNFDRLQALEAQELLSEEEYENARLSMQQSEIAWKQAALNLRHTTVTAPISGYIGERTVNLGDRIQTSTPLFSIANLDEKIVRVYVPQNEYVNCYVKQKAAVSTDIIEGERFSAYVKRISPVIDPQSGTFKVTLAVKDPQNRLRPGMFVNAELIVDTHKNARLIPKSALLYENERTYFYIVESDSSVKVQLQKGFEDAEKVEVLNDLAVGTQVVVLGQNGLKDGNKVRITEERSYPWQDKTQLSHGAPAGSKGRKAAAANAAGNG